MHAQNPPRRLHIQKMPLPGLLPRAQARPQRANRLLKRLSHLPGVRKVFVASGIRPDLIAADTRHGAAYIDELVAHHVSGQLKLAPEHADRSCCARWVNPPRGLLDFVSISMRRTRATASSSF
jgi:hypothetical protein